MSFVGTFASKDGREPKEACEFHTWDEHGRPDPPAGYCGPNCRMRPNQQLSSYEAQHPREKVGI